MAWKSIAKIKYNGAEFNFMNTPPEWTFLYNQTKVVFVNKFVSLSYYRNREEMEMYSYWLASNPNVFMGGEWAKEHHTKGEKERLFTFPNGYYFEVSCTLTSTTAPQIVLRLMRPNGTYLFSALGDGINGVGVVNHSLVPNLWVDTTNKKAVIGTARDVRTSTNWGGTFDNPITNDPWTDAQQTELYNVVYDLLPPGFLEDTSKTGGGKGDYEDNYSDIIGLPDITNLNVNSISNTKFFTCYKMTPAELSKLSDELWSENIFTILSNSVLKPTDFVVSLNMIPIDVSARTVYIKAGSFYLNGATGGLISAQFVRLDCGSLEIKNKWGGAIDYQTDISLFLPFIGEVSLNANEVIGSTISIIYTIDIMSGNCIASVRVVNDNLDSILYQYNGNVASSYSITSADYSNVFSGALQLATIGTGNISSGNVTSIVNSTSNMLSGQSFQRTGNLSTSAGFMGIKKPYLILSRPIQSLPENYSAFHGFVSNVTMNLKDCNGYTQVDSIHIDNVPCMEEEKTQLLRILKEGIII